MGNITDTFLLFQIVKLPSATSFIRAAGLSSQRNVRNVYTPRVMKWARVKIPFPVVDIPCIDVESVMKRFRVLAIPPHVG